MPKTDLFCSFLKIRSLEFGIFVLSLVSVVLMFLINAVRQTTAIRAWLNMVSKLEVNILFLP